jgi:hypothetical protein
MNISDSSRYNLVTNFRCSVCGNKLQLSYDKIKSPEYKPETDDDITGAHKVEVSITVHPCEKCYSAATEPLNALKRILKD